MSSAAYQTQTISTPRSAFDRLALARELFREYHARCFWNSPRDLEITEENVPFVVRGLRLFGGSTGFKLAGKLRPGAPDQEAMGCR
jgi:hypothetical protein